MRLWVERSVIGLLSFLAIFLPLVIGLALYLAITDGITVGEGDPTREARLWMVKDSRNFGVAYSAPIVAQAASPAAGQVCIRNNFLYLRLRGGLRLEGNAEFCKCYAQKDGRWVPTTDMCR